MSHTQLASDLAEANRRIDAYSAARAAGYSIAKSRQMALYGRTVVDDTATASLTPGPRWSIVNDLVDVSDLPGGKVWA